MATGNQLHVRSLHRYPVTSMLGEAVTTVTLGRTGTEAERYRPNFAAVTPPGYPASVV